MNKLQYKTYKFGNFIFSKIDDEITILHKGKNKIYSKVIPLGIFSGKGAYFLSISIIISIFVITFFVYKNIISNSYENTNENSYEKDEKQKVELLLSKKTDFSAQQKLEPLKVREHVVTDGDTISGLAKEYGVTMDTICGSNKLTSYDIIQTGKKLLIPNRDGIIHEVAKGQTIIDIAKNYKVQVEKIFAENEIKNFDFISPGDVIFVPDAKPLNIMPGFMWPTRGWRITSSYGWRRNPVDGQRQFHVGLDIRSNYQLIRATKYGKVTYTGWLAGYGYAIVIAHPGGWKSLYGHLSKIMVNYGQYVKQGQWIGRSGNTGVSTGPHLHFELIKNGVNKNPRRYLSR